MEAASGRFGSPDRRRRRALYRRRRLARRPDRPPKVIAACSNGTAGAVAVKASKAIGVVELIEMDRELDYAFPKYNPNPEENVMLKAMAKALKQHGAHVAPGFAGDGDRCCVVDDEREEIFADKIGLMIARISRKLHADATVFVDVKSTSLFATQEVLKANGAKTGYWRTGHSYMKQNIAEYGALAGFEKSGGFVFNTPLGRGYDDGVPAAATTLALLDRNQGKSSRTKRRRCRSPAPR